MLRCLKVGGHGVPQLRRDILLKTTYFYLTYIFEFLHNIFFRHELLKDEEIIENGGSGLNILILKRHVFGSSDLSFDFRALRPVAIERACEYGLGMVFSSFGTSHYSENLEFAVTW